MHLTKQRTILPLSHVKVRYKEEVDKPKRAYTTSTKRYEGMKKGGKYQESIQSSTTLDPGYHMGK